MNETQETGRLTGRERLTATLLRRAPWLAFLLIVPPAPLVFLWKYLTATEDAGVWMLFALTSLGIGTVAAAFVCLFLLLYRRRWETRLRDRLAADGITADELGWFQKELSAHERQTLKEMEANNRLLADAYRETLAARLTAARVLTSAERDTTLVERRLQQTSALQGGERAKLEADLRQDRQRLERIANDARTHRAELETRLQMIEAAASRGLSEAETARALLRLDIVREDTPYALDAARNEFEAQEEVERMLREGNRNRLRQGEGNRNG
ncbi:MAG TPA: hypothetical protein VGB73_15390 [Pyrinomonadaceae bacterium]|jgi:hypothetical protein